MTVSKEVISVIWQIVSITGLVSENGWPVPRTTLPPKYLRTRNALRAKAIACEEVGLADKSIPAISLKNSDIEWVPNSDGYEPPDGKAVVTSRFVDSELELTDKEKDMVRFFLSERDEVPELTDAQLDEFKEVTGFPLDAE